MICTHLKVTQYVESWQGKSIMALHPGVFPYAFVVEMLGESFLCDRLIDGTLVPVAKDDAPCP